MATRSTASLWFEESVAGAIGRNDVQFLQRMTDYAKHRPSATELETAVEIQDNLTYIALPAFYYPMRETLGALLLAASHPCRAASAVASYLLPTGD